MANYSYSSEILQAKKAFEKGNFNAALEHAIEARRIAIFSMNEDIASWYVQSAHEIVQKSYAGLRA